MRLRFRLSLILLITFLILFATNYCSTRFLSNLQSEFANLLSSVVSLILILAFARILLNHQLHILKNVFSSSKAINGADYTISTMSDVSDSLGDFARTFDNMRIDIAQASMAIREVSGEREITQERYQRLFESTQDLIFSMKPNLMITNANPSAMESLGMGGTSLAGKNFFDLIALDPERSMAPVLLMGELANFTEKRRPMSRRLSFLKADGNETAEYDVRLEFLNVKGADEITARATPLQVDPLVKSLVSETLEFQMQSDILLVDTMANRLSRNLLRYANEDDAFGISLGVREMLINAIEHGNLGITYQQKTKAMESDDYMKLLEERTRDDRYSKRKVSIQYRLAPDRVTYTIADQGDGFDHKNSLQKEMPDSKSAHGRGILITENIFDEFEYNEKGNSISMVKYFQPTG